MSNYAPPVDSLLTFGDCRELPPDKTDYLALGLEAEHIPELIRMAMDDELLWADSDDPVVWGPVHAWRALGQLRAAEAVEPLLNIMDEQEEEGDDWFLEEMPKIFGQIGPAALPALIRYVTVEKHLLYSQCAALGGIKEIGLQHPGAREEANAALIGLLEKYEENDISLNGFLIDDLTDLQADEALPLIRRAMENTRVDETIIDWGSIVEKFDLPPNDDDPLCHPKRSQWFWKTMYDFGDAGAKTKRAKTKSKHKQQKASRKRNRKRK